MIKIVKVLFGDKKTSLVRQLCTKKKEPQYTAENLKDRSVILVTGKDSTSLLQKLVTNDLSKLDERNKSIFSIFLNDKGKVLHDVIIYKYGDNYLLEVDSRALQPVKIHLKLFKGGRQVDVKNLEDKLSVWAVLGQGEIELEKLKEVDMGEYWLSCMDPRLELLGLRIIGPKKGDVVSTLRNSGLPVVRSQRNSHQLLRYKLGVAQGLSEIPLGRCNPTEMNADFLSAICPKKTNFFGWHPNLISQSLTRRVFPLHFTTDVEDSLSLNAPIQDEKGIKKSPIGYLCGIKKNVGLGLLAVTEVLKATQVRICNKQKHFFVNCSRPSWWPDEESSSSSSSQ